MSTPARKDSNLDGLDLYAPRRRSGTATAPELEVAPSQSQSSSAPTHDELNEDELGEEEFNEEEFNEEENNLTNEEESDQPNEQEDVRHTGDAEVITAAEARLDDAIHAAIEIGRPFPASPMSLPPAANLRLPRGNTASRHWSAAERFDREPTDMQSPRRSRLDPEIVPEPPIGRQGGGVPLLLQYGLVAAFAAIAAYGLTMVLSSQPRSGLPVVKNDLGTTGNRVSENRAPEYRPPEDRVPENRTSNDPARLSVAQQPAAQEAVEQQPVVLAPARLVVEDQRTFANEPLSLGVSVDGAADHDSLLLAGLAAGTRVSMGLPVGQSAWQLPLQNLSSVVVYAPKDFTGVMNTAIDLISPEKRLMDSRAVRFEWLAKQSPPAMTVMKQVDTGSPSVAPVAPVQQIDQERAALLLKRGQDLLNSGDIASARLAFKHLAEAGNSQAALALGATYDPNYLASRNVIGVVGDPEMARTWYQRAVDLGSADAKRLLAALDTK